LIALIYQGSSAVISEQSTVNRYLCVHGSLITDHRLPMPSFASIDDR
jgi:hypothetical protein